MDYIILGFGSYNWTLNLKWRDDIAYLDHSWLDFVEANNLTAGDVVVLQQTNSWNKFKLAFFPHDLFSKEDSRRGIIMGMFTYFVIFYISIQQLFNY